MTLGFFDAQAGTARSAGGRDALSLLDWALLLGIATLSLQSVTFGMTQAGHLWGVPMCAYLLFRRRLRISTLEVGVFLVFLAVALINTGLLDVDRIKQGQQAFKFALVYPAFYLIGRFYGEYYSDRRLPFGWLFVAGFILLQWLVQYLAVPVIHKPLLFQEGALHGTFRERNWFAVMVFFLVYVLMLRSPSCVRAASGLLFTCVALAFLSGSKSVLVVAAIALLFAFRGQLTLKAIGVIGGAMVFYQLFGWQLSGEMLRVRLEDERGLAWLLSMDLLRRDWLGYGLGFVEAHFGGWWITVQGLGYGVSSVFSAPLDLSLIAGPFGLLFWLVFFFGIGLGLRTSILLAPITAWSLINPLHQSEIVYLMLGYLVAWAQPRAVARTTATHNDGLPRPDSDAVSAGVRA